MPRSIIPATMLRYSACLIPLAITACVVVPPSGPYYASSAPQYLSPGQDSPTVEMIYEEPPLSQPQPVAVSWAPPPMLVEMPPPAPYPDAIWVGGYWVWQGNWAWARGHWAAPPRPGYYWVHPYYENRNGEVIFVTGYWSSPHAHFSPPPMNMRINPAWIKPGTVHGPRPLGPSGVFVPAPPHSRPGIIVPAPLGTPPAVVTSAPPAVNVGMRIQNNNGKMAANNAGHNSNVSIVAPPGAVANHGKPLDAVVPAQPHLAAAMHPAEGRPTPTFAMERHDAPAMNGNGSMPPNAAHGPGQPGTPGTAAHMPTNGAVSSWSPSTPSAPSASQFQERRPAPAQATQPNAVESYRHPAPSEATRENGMPHSRAEFQRNVNPDLHHASPSREQAPMQRDMHPPQAPAAHGSQHEHGPAAHQTARSKDPRNDDAQDHSHARHENKSD